MATVDRQIDHPGRGLRPAPDAGRQHDHEPLADIIAIRSLPLPPRRNGLLTSLITWVRVVASPLPQATPVRSTPRPPTSPAPLPFRSPRAPHDAA